MTGAAAAFFLRPAQPSDAAALLEIYAPYVTDTAVTFEYDVPRETEFAARIAATLRRYPYLAAVKAGKIIGYAYAAAFQSRPAYGWAAETSIYVAADERGQGVGRSLYAALEEILRRQRILNVNACIAYPNPASVEFHQRQGFRPVGRFTQCGYKFGRWYDTIWMEKLLGAHGAPPEPVLPAASVDWGPRVGTPR